jgi:hypothetical protein
MARLTRWARGHHIPIDSSMYLEGTTIKAIMELKFNPGEGVAHLSLSDNALSILACRGRTSVKTEQIREREEALSATENTRQLDKLLHLSTCAPVDNSWELKIIIAIFMSFVWVLFGSVCDYCKGFDVSQILRTVRIGTFWCARPRSDARRVPKVRRLKSDLGIS